VFCDLVDLRGISGFFGIFEFWVFAGVLVGFDVFLAI